MSAHIVRRAPFPRLLPNGLPCPCPPRLLPVRPPCHCPPRLPPACLLSRLQDALESIVEMREHDVPFHVRFAIDTDTRCGHWYTVKAKVGRCPYVVACYHGFVLHTLLKNAQSTSPGARLGPGWDRAPGGLPLRSTVLAAAWRGSAAARGPPCISPPHHPALREKERQPPDLCALRQAHSCLC